ncbi:putative WD repeat-containing protein C2E1P5.05 [Mycena venus]|uniref:Putative WD repeat-containing protein C2E1P5.05 n=1 Tax=Mycena venus TaxID=2733690 RepID=A0A8H7CZD5_9AGAR|nr:putative WD repeat-containing protein C2E1P5.05 [Mycena venus]
MGLAQSNTLRTLKYLEYAVARGFPSAFRCQNTDLCSSSSSSFPFYTSSTLYPLKESHASTVPTNGEMLSTKRCPLPPHLFFAVIVGINEYHETSHLQGAVNDARAFENYLLDLGVPPSNIIFLKNETATRANILSTIQSHLRDNPNIPDHMEAEKIFFFAGHGSRTGAPRKVYAPEGQVEVICPVDERTTDATGKYVHAIPDYVLRRLFCSIAAKNGPNNTVILDCCSSGGMDRNVEVPRTAGSDSCEVPLDLDNQLWKGQTGAVHWRMWSEAAKPYVMLAACRADQKATEFLKFDGTYGGRFTANIIPLLQQILFGHTTYSELVNGMEKLPSGQIPQSVGTRSNRPIFTRNFPATGHRAVLLKPQGPSHALGKRKRKFRVEMGTLEGVLRGTEFRIYGLNNSVLGAFVARSVQVDHSILVSQDEHPAESPRWAHAKVSDWNNPSVLLYTPDDFPYTAAFFSAHTTRSPRFTPASSLEEAHIAVHCDGDEIVVEQRTSTTPIVQQETRFLFKGNPAHLPEVIDGITYFSDLLGCCNKKKPLKGFMFEMHDFHGEVIDGIAHFDYFLGCNHNQRDGLEGVRLEMHRLQGVYPACRPADLSDNLVKNGEVRLTSEAGAEYGFTIRNTSPNDLFPYLFYFDMETKTIHPWYLPDGARVDHCPLPSGGTVKIGMGSDPAFDFTLPPGELSSSGFFKLFVTRKYINLAWMQQQLSPFDPRFEGTGRPRMSRKSLDLMSMKWGTLTVPLTIAASQQLNSLN